MRDELLARLRVERQGAEDKDDDRGAADDGHARIIKGVREKALRRRTRSNGRTRNNGEDTERQGKQTVKASPRRTRTRFGERRAPSITAPADVAVSPVPRPHRRNVPVNWKALSAGAIGAPARKRADSGRNSRDFARRPRAVTRILTRPLSTKCADLQNCVQKRGAHSDARVRFQDKTAAPGRGRFGFPPVVSARNSRGTRTGSAGSSRARPSGPRCW
jgi:hypothetical protein